MTNGFSLWIPSSYQLVQIVRNKCGYHSISSNYHSNHTSLTNPIRDLSAANGVTVMLVKIVKLAVSTISVP
jgi:hypothetical protein